MSKQPLLISACLLGEKCRYDGQSNPMDAETLEQLNERYDLVPVCPECLGGLPIPRLPSERVGDRVLMRDGTDVTAQYALGAERALEIAKAKGCARALLKERSPSCGSGLIHDGSFTKDGLIPGDGVTAALLKANAVKIYGESRCETLFSVKNEITGC